jgi:Mce-associated membrane protein
MPPTAMTPYQKRWPNSPRPRPLKPRLSPRLRDAPEDSGSDEDEATAEPAGPKRRRLWRIAAAVAVLAICALATVSGVMISKHRQVAAKQAHSAEFVTAARNGVVALLSIDYNHAKADVQRVIDSSTGPFRDDFTKNADDFVKTAEQSKAVTQGSITASALDSENGDTGVVLLAAKSQVTNAAGARQDPRAWRMSVTVTRDGGQLKMSNVEFVP